MTKILVEHRPILEKIRALYVESGGELLYKLEDFGLNAWHKSAEGLEVSFDYDVPGKLYTPEGSYEILGSSVSGDVDKFWALFCEAFNVEVIRPRRDDSKTNGFAFQTQPSGPLVRITARN